MIQIDRLLKGAAAQLPQTEASTDTVATVAAAPHRHFELKAIEGMSIDDLISRLVTTLVDFALHLVVAILVFYVGKFVIGRIYKMVDGVFLRRHVDRSLATFVLSLVRIVLYFILVVTVIGIIGIETSSFLALFASAGVAIGLALSGTLQNFAGGVLILLLKPYKIGDYIEAQGYAGTVKEIQIFSTLINTPDNKQILIPNGPLSTSSINNYSKEDYRRVDWTVSIAYGDDVATARRAIVEMLLSDERVVKQYIEDDRLNRGHFPDDAAEPEQQHAAIADDCLKISRVCRFFNRKKKIASQAHRIENSNAEAWAMMTKVDRSPVVMVASLGASSVDLTVRAWTPSTTFWSLYFEMNERFYTELPSHGINFPFPQLDVHLQK